MDAGTPQIVAESSGLKEILSEVRKTSQEGVQRNAAFISASIAADQAARQVEKAGKELSEGAKATSESAEEIRKARTERIEKASEKIKGVGEALGKSAEGKSGEGCGCGPGGGAEAGEGFAGAAPSYRGKEYYEFTYQKSALKEAEHNPFADAMEAEMEHEHNQARMATEIANSSENGADDIRAIVAQLNELDKTTAQLAKDIPLSTSQFDELHEGLLKGGMSAKYLTTYSGMELQRMLASLSVVTGQNPGELASSYTKARKKLGVNLSYDYDLTDLFATVFGETQVKPQEFMETAAKFLPKANESELSGAKGVKIGANVFAALQKQAGGEDVSVKDVYKALGRIGEDRSFLDKEGQFVGFDKVLETLHTAQESGHLDRVAHRIAGKDEGVERVTRLLGVLGDERYKKATEDLESKTGLRESISLINAIDPTARFTENTTLQQLKKDASVAPVAQDEISKLYKSNEQLSKDTVDLLSDPEKARKEGEKMQSTSSWNQTLDKVKEVTSEILEWAGIIGGLSAGLMTSGGIKGAGGEPGVPPELPPVAYLPPYSKGSEGDHYSNLYPRGAFPQPRGSGFGPTLGFAVPGLSFGFTGLPLGFAGSQSLFARTAALGTSKGLGDELQQQWKAVESESASSAKSLQTLAESAGAAASALSSVAASSGGTGGQPDSPHAKTGPTVSGKLPSRAIGGVVKKTGAALIHSGEVIQPANVTHGISARPGAPPAMNFHYSPSINVAGPADPAAIRRMLDQHADVIMKKIDSRMRELAIGR